MVWHLGRGELLVRALNDLECWVGVAAIHVVAPCAASTALACTRPRWSRLFGMGAIAVAVSLAVAACGDGMEGAPDTSVLDASVPDAISLDVADGTGVSGQHAYIKASNTDKDDLLGWSVALSQSGDTLAVGAPGEDSSATGVDGDQDDNSAWTSGAVYVFRRTDSTWAQHAYVKASNTDPRDGFSRSVALSASGDTLAVGAPGEASSAAGVNGDQTDNSTEDCGVVYVFH